MPASEIPVLNATWADLNQPFEKFIQKHERVIAKAGLAKIIVDEKDWTPRSRGYTDLDYKIEKCIKQVATGARGLWRFLLVEHKKTMSLKHEFEPLATSEDNQPGTDDPLEVDRKYWKNVSIRPPLYGADIHGSLFDESCKGWTLRNLDTMLSKMLLEAGHELPGVTSPYLYFGMWRSTFAWHCEDMDLYSVNYLHYGANKHWYCIPPEHKLKFESMVKSLLPDLFRACPEFMRHKELLISPHLLDQHKVPYVKAVQNPREFMINYPGAYHCGFNAGYNCAESVNFGTKQWIPIGARASICECTPDSVQIDMRMFRHLVPSKLLPPELLLDTEEEDEEEEEVEEEEVEEEEEEVVRSRSKSRSKPMIKGGRRMMAAAVEQVEEEEEPDEEDDEDDDDDDDDEEEEEAVSCYGSEDMAAEAAEDEEIILGNKRGARNAGARSVTKRQKGSRGSESRKGQRSVGLSSASPNSSGRSSLSGLAQGSGMKRTARRGGLRQVAGSKLARILEGREDEDEDEDEDEEERVVVVRGKKAVSVSRTRGKFQSDSNKRAAAASPLSSSKKKPRERSLVVSGKRKVKATWKVAEGRRKGTGDDFYFF